MYITCPKCGKKIVPVRTKEVETETKTGKKKVMRGECPYCHAIIYYHQSK